MLAVTTTSNGTLLVLVLSLLYYVIGELFLWAIFDFFLSTASNRIDMTYMRGMILLQSQRLQPSMRICTNSAMYLGLTG